MLVNVEGISGAGKTTATKMLREFIGDNCIVAGGFNVGPSSTVLTKLCRKLVQQERMFNLPIVSELHLLIAEMTMDITVNVIPALKSGKVVLYDNYWRSILYYETAIAHVNAKNDKLLIDYINDTFRRVESYCDIPVPNITLFLTCSIKTSVRRIEQRNRARLSEVDINVLKKVDELYRKNTISDCATIIQNEGSIGELRLMLAHIVRDKMGIVNG